MATGGWDVPIALLLVLCVAELYAAGWLARRDQRLLVAAPCPSPAAKLERGKPGRT